MKISDQVNCLYLIAISLGAVQFFAYVSLSQHLEMTDVVGGSTLGPDVSSIMFTLLYSNMLSTLEIVCFLLIFLYLHDYKILKIRQHIGESASLDLSGIRYINQNFQLDTVIIHEDEDCGRPKMYQHSLSRYSAVDLNNEFQQYEQYQREFEENLEGIPRQGEAFIRVSTLPHLPLVSHQKNREQVGLFSVQNIPQWSLFYWMGDIHVIHNSERHLLSSTVKMNRRTLASFDEVNFFQGGDSQQRSGCGVLANFFWCNTRSTPSSLSPYWILPSHFLGEPNCVYVTTKKDGQLCSALLVFKEIRANEQILMFIGSDQEAKTVERYVRFYKVIPLLAGCGLGLTLLKYMLIML
jgi:hypothetical protein